MIGLGFKGPVERIFDSLYVCYKGLLSPERHFPWLTEMFILHIKWLLEFTRFIQN